MCGLKLAQAIPILKQQGTVLMSLVISVSMIRDLLLTNWAVVFWSTIMCGPMYNVGN